MIARLLLLIRDMFPTKLSGTEAWRVIWKGIIYRILKAVGGVNKSDQFKDTDESRAKARKTWASMEAFRREVVARVGQMADEGAVPSFDEWPEGFDGPALRVKGILYKLDSGGYVRMQDLGVSEADMPAEVSE